MESIDIIKMENSEMEKMENSEMAQSVIVQFQTFQSQSSQFLPHFGLTDRSDHCLKPILLNEQHNHQESKWTEKKGENKQTDKEEKGEKSGRNHRILAAENKRLRRLNEEYSNKIKKLEKLGEARDKMFNNFSKISDDTKYFSDDFSIEQV